MLAWDGIGSQPYFVTYLITKHIARLGDALLRHRDEVGARCWRQKAFQELSSPLRLQLIFASTEPPGLVPGREMLRDFLGCGGRGTVSIGHVSNTNKQ